MACFIDETFPINISFGFELLSIEKLYLKPEHPPPSTETRKNEPFGSFNKFYYCCISIYLKCIHIIIINGY